MWSGMRGACLFGPYVVLPAGFPAARVVPAVQTAKGYHAMPRPRARRSPGLGSIYELPNGRWAGAIIVTEQDGTRRRVYRKARTKTEVQRALDEVRREADKGSLSKSQPLTFNA